MGHREKKEIEQAWCQTYLQTLRFHALNGDINMFTLVDSKMDPSCLDLPKQQLPDDEELPSLAHTSRNLSPFYQDEAESISHSPSLLLLERLGVLGGFSPLHVALVLLPSIFLFSSPQYMLLNAAAKAFLVAA